MPEPLTTYINQWRERYDAISGDMWMCGNALKQAAVYIAAQNWNYASLFIDAAGDAMHDIAYGFDVDPDSLYYTAYNALHWIDDNIGGGGSVDMDAIINAMLQAEFNQLEKFIGLVDAYRVAIWNAPFNADFYAALARGFIKWPQY